MLRLILNLWIVICQLCAVSMLILRFCFAFAFDWIVKVSDFMKKHRVITIIYIVFGAFGLFYTIVHIL